MSLSSCPCRGWARCSGFRWARGKGDAHAFPDVSWRFAWGRPAALAFKDFLFLNNTSRLFFFQLCPHFKEKSQCNCHANQMKACKIHFLQDVGACIKLTPGDLWLCQWHTPFKSMQMKTLPTPQANSLLRPCCSHGTGNVWWVKS